MDKNAPRVQVELSFRGFLLGILITLVFTAANVYLGLKVGLTFATSIPAAVISMAVLNTFRDATVVENNIVQTVASAAGTLSSIIFVLPGLLIVGWGGDFSFLGFFPLLPRRLHVGRVFHDSLETHARHGFEPALPGGRSGSGSLDC